jgi:hypothetical protein
MQDQKSMVGLINGTEPKFRVGTATRTVGGKTELRVVDPVADSSADDFEIDPVIWISEYYGPLTQLVNDPVTHDDLGRSQFRLPGTVVEFGIPADLIAIFPAIQERAVSRRRDLRPVHRGDEMPSNATLWEQVNSNDRGLLEDLLPTIEGSYLEGAARDGISVDAPYLD